MASPSDATAGVATMPTSFPAAQLSATDNADSTMKRPRPVTSPAAIPGNVLDFHRNQFAAKDEVQTVQGTMGRSSGGGVLLYPHVDTSRQYCRN